MSNPRHKLWAWPWELRRAGIMGVNTRNRDFISRCNPRRSFPGADDKAVTKEICTARGIAVPETYAIIERLGDLRKLPELLGTRPAFVVKPARGSGGRGVLVIERRRGDVFETAKGETISPAKLRYHVSATLSGLYSLGGHWDRAIVEQQILPHPVFHDLAVDGTPDIRIIVYSGTPVMAMLRLPTRASKGRANLHQGAVAAGIDLGTGRTFGGVCRARKTEIHPDTGQPLAGVTIPHWKGALATAANVSQALGMGYVGVDVVVDAQQGPVVIEANARPGLAIQIANCTGLRPRLTAVGSQRLETARPIRFACHDRACAQQEDSAQGVSAGLGGPSPFSRIKPI